MTSTTRMPPVPGRSDRTAIIPFPPAFEATPPAKIARRSFLSNATVAIGLGAAATANVVAITSARASAPAADVSANAAGVCHFSRRATEAAGDDIELLRLYAEYVDRSLAVLNAEERHRPGRAAFDAELPPCPDDVILGHHFRDHDWLWRKHGLDETWDAVNATSAELRRTIGAILRTDAVGLFGVGVKLTVIRRWSDAESEDYEDAVAVVLRDIDRVIETTFATGLKEPDLTAFDPVSEDDEDDDEALS